MAKNKTINMVKSQVIYKDYSKDAERTALVSGENLAHMFGKIARWYTDISWVGHTHTEANITDFGTYAGASTKGGAATSANKLNIGSSDIGSETKPVYFSYLTGKPVACTYSLNASVPANAVFTDINVKQSPSTADESREVLFAGNTGNTDTTGTVGKSNKLYFNPSTGALTATSFSGSVNASNLTGTIDVGKLPTTSVVAGSYGPAAGGTLAHGGTFDVGYVTVDKYGRLTAASTKTFTLPAQYVHPTTSGNKHIPSGGSSGQYLKWSSDGTATWSAIAAADLPSHTHSEYLPLAGGTMTGTLNLAADKYDTNCGLDCKNSSIIGVNDIRFNDQSQDADEGILFYRSATTWDSIWAANGSIRFTPNYPTDTTAYTVYHSGNLTYSTIGAAPASHTHSASDIISGTLANLRLPARLQEYQSTAVSSLNETITGFYYSGDNSSSPFKSLHSSYLDYMLLVQGYSSTWASQIATDYRSNNMALRIKNNGTWSNWSLFLTNSNYSSYVTPAGIGALSTSTKYALSDTVGGCAISSYSNHLKYGNEMNISKLASTGHVWFGYRWDTDGTAENGKDIDRYITKYIFGNCAGDGSKAQVEASAFIGNASSADIPYGFSSRTTSAAWTVGGTFVTGWDAGNGCEIAFVKDYPASKQLSCCIDGYFFQNEGKKRVLDEANYSSYVTPAGIGALSTSTKYALSETVGGPAISATAIKFSHGNEVNFSKLTGNYKDIYFGWRWREADGTESSDDEAGLECYHFLKGNGTNSYAAIKASEFQGNATSATTATTASKLGTNAGSNTCPVYFSGGVPVACKQVASGAYFNIVPWVRSDGVMDVGRYIDFHRTDNATSLGYRINNWTTNSIEFATYNSPNNIVNIYAGAGGYTQLRFQTNETDKAYAATGIVVRPLTTSGAIMQIESGGNTLIGGGESTSTLYSNGYDNLNTTENESLYLSADGSVHFITNAQAYSGIKTIVMDTSGNLKIGSTQSFVQTQNSGSNFTEAIKWWKGGTNPGNYGPSIGQHNTGDTDGSICILPYNTSTSPWGGNVGLFISKTRLLFNGTAISLNGHTHSYLPLSGGTLTGYLKLGASDTETLPNCGITIHDIRSVNVPAAGFGSGKLVNFYFHCTDTPNTEWWSIMHMKGWTGAYCAWELAGTAHNGDGRSRPLYVRTSNENTAWGSWRKIYDSSNKPTLSELGAASSSHTHTYLIDPGDSSYKIELAWSGASVPATDTTTYPAVFTKYNLTSGISVRVKESSWDAYKTFLGLGSAAYTASSDYVPNTRAGMIAGINLLDTATAAPTDDSYYISQENNASTTNYYRRKHSGLWSYIKGKADSVYAPISHSHNLITKNDAITYGASRLQWFDLSGTGTVSASTAYNPSNDWYHHIMLNHGNSNGYYIDLAICFHADAFYYKRIVSGSIANASRNNGWVRILDEFNYTTYVTPANIGAAASGHNHDNSYVAKSMLDVSTTANLGLDGGKNAFGYVSGLTKAAWNNNQTDGVIIRQFYNASWKTELFIDYRTGQTSVRGKNNGTFTDWGSFAILKSDGSYWGMCSPSGANNVWIRTTTLGIIPNESGGLGSGHGGIGTSSWYFSYMHCDTYNGATLKLGSSSVQGLIEIQGTTSGSVSYGSSNPRIRFKNADNSQNIDIVMNDWDSVRAPASLSIHGNQGGEYLLAPNISAWDYTNNKLMAMLSAWSLGTTSAVGQGRIIAGNGTKKGTAGNARGLVEIYSEQDGAAFIIAPPSLTTDVTLTLPSTSGTLELVGHTHSQYLSSSTVYAKGVTQNGDAVAAQSLRVTHGNEINASKPGDYNYIWFFYRWNTGGTEDTSGSKYIDEIYFGNGNGAGTNTSVGRFADLRFNNIAAGTLRHTGADTSWWNDRNVAMLYQSYGDSNYRPTWGTATKDDGSWCCGNYNTNDLTFNYIPYSVYNSGQNPTLYKQIIFTEDAKIEARGYNVINNGSGRLVMDYSGIAITNSRAGVWAVGIDVKNASGTLLSAIGVLGNDTSLTYTYLGGSYDNPIIKLDSSGYATFKDGMKVNNNISLQETKNIILRPNHSSYTAGIGYDTSGNECIAIWAKNTVTRLRWYAGTDMTTMTSGTMMGITPDFEISKASGTAKGYIGGDSIVTYKILWSGSTSCPARSSTDITLSTAVAANKYRFIKIVWNVSSGTGVSEIRADTLNVINNVSSASGAATANIIQFTISSDGKKLTVGPGTTAITVLQIAGVCVI